MGLTRQDVEKVALLARLRLSAEELDALTEQLSKVVGYVEQLGELDTEGVAPMAHAVEVTNVFRDDAVQPSLAREQALASAPHHDGACFLVPAVLGD
ncbi:MAG: Asp-tRNA(Asn)/Glu-tRNA(Gln) amidotransferase subunit GatC [Planctomycetia bacterium]|nr:Asp-tRNA(Asn)/Glu-tRNA(Gln) amidotransferase subunit GatC [Planctomycetia bacterium]